MQLPRVSFGWRGAVLGVVCLGAAVAVALIDPVVRTSSFHHYADQRSLWGIPYFGDVLSNLPFVVVGLLGLRLARRAVGLPRPLVALAFLGVLGIGVGSGWYHLDPVDTRLAFDWGPIVIALSWMVALVVADRINVGVGVAAAVVLPLLSVASVGYWWAGGGFADGGDLRFYVALQLLLVAVVPLIVFLYPSGRIDRWWLLAAVGSFVVARVVARNDVVLLDAIGVSGHTLKHLIMGAATGCVLRACRSLAPPRA